MPTTPPARTFTATIRGSDAHAMTAIDLPFDPKAAFGKSRAPVRVTLNGYTYRSTTFIMRGERFVPLRTSHREAAGVRAGQRCRVTLALDAAPRRVALPADLATALREYGLLPAFKAMSYTHQREHVEAITSAKKPETRARRIAACVAMLRARAKPSVPKPRARKAPASSRSAKPAKPRA